MFIKLTEFHNINSCEKKEDILFKDYIINVNNIVSIGCDYNLTTKESFSAVFFKNRNHVHVKESIDEIMQKINVAKFTDVNLGECYIKPDNPYKKMWDHFQEKYDGKYIALNTGLLPARYIHDDDCGKFVSISKVMDKIKKEYI